MVYPILFPLGICFALTFLLSSYLIVATEAAVQAVTAPNYVLEESLSNQLLWKKTAGNRPPQPVEERAFFEAQWAENFAMSEVKYRMPAEVLTATTPVSLNPFADGNFGSVGTSVAEVGGAKIGGGNHHDVADIVSSFVVPGGTSGHGTSAAHHNPHLQKPHRVVRSSSGSGRNLIVYAKGDNVFGTTVSKSFPRPSINGELVSGVNTLNISIASYRVVEVSGTDPSVRMILALDINQSQVFLFSLPFLNRKHSSPINVGSMHNFSLFFERVAFEIRLGFGNDIRISKNYPKKLPGYTKAVPLLSLI